MAEHVAWLHMKVNLTNLMSHEEEEEMAEGGHFK